MILGGNASLFSKREIFAIAHMQKDWGIPVIMGTSALATLCLALGDEQIIKTWRCQQNPKILLMLLHTIPLITIIKTISSPKLLILPTTALIHYYHIKARAPHIDTRL